MNNRLLLIVIVLNLCCVTSFIGQEKIEIDGAIIIGNSEGATPVPGTIRYNPNNSDFEGYNGEWHSLTGNAVLSGSGTITDIDGNRYRTVTIGSQTWMRENLKTTRYNDGTSIPERPLNSQWNSNTPAWCWYENNHAYDTPYAKLYNWYVVDPVSNGNRNVCPIGWHVPNDSDWNELSSFLGGSDLAGGKLMEVGLNHWASPNVFASNESGFTALPAGYRGTDGAYFFVTFSGYWWSTTSSGGSNANYRYVVYFTDEFFSVNSDRNLGFSIRCLKD